MRTVRMASHRMNVGISPEKRILPRRKRRRTLPRKYFLNNAL
jgi:hypothetical protein